MIVLYCVVNICTSVKSVTCKISVCGDFGRSFFQPECTFNDVPITVTMIFLPEYYYVSCRMRSMSKAKIKITDYTKDNEPKRLCLFRIDFALVRKYFSVW